MDIGLQSDKDQALEGARTFGGKNVFTYTCLCIPDFEHAVFVPGSIQCAVFWKT